MPIYSFEDRDGQPVEMHLPMGEAPSWGEWTEIDGRMLMRVIERPPVPHVPEYRCLIKSQAPFDPTYPRTDEHGHGVILNKREHDDYKAKNPHLVWD